MVSQTRRLRSNVADVITELDGFIEQVTGMLNVLAMNVAENDVAYMAALDVAYIAVATLREQVARLREVVR